MCSSNKQVKNSLDWILLAKGFGIILVVIGHFHPASSPEYWTIIRNVIYSFHMPLFFLLSGYLYTHDKYSYPELLNRKVKRLLFPFLSIAILFFIIKYVAGIMVEIDNPVNLISFVNIFIDPIHSYMTLLWFVHSLFLIFVLYPILRNILNNLMIFCLSIVLAYLFSNTIFIGNAMYNLPFFAFGVLAKSNSHLNKHLFAKPALTLLIYSIAFAFLYIFSYSQVSFEISNYITRLLLGISGAISVVAICNLKITSNGFPFDKILQQIGYYSMTIYLFHTLFESTVRIFFFRVIDYPQIPFEMIAILAIIAGVTCPLLLEKYIIRKSILGRRYILGIS